MLDRPVKPIATAHAEINDIHTNLYEVLDSVVQYCNELEERVKALEEKSEELDERVKALEGDSNESNSNEI